MFGVIKHSRGLWEETRVRLDSPSVITCQCLIPRWRRNACVSIAAKFDHSSLRVASVIVLMAFRLRNAKLRKEELRARLRVLFANALTGEIVLVAERSHGATDCTLQSLFQWERPVVDHLQMHTTFLVDGKEADPNLQPWSFAKEETDGNLTVKILHVLVLQWLPQIRVVPFVALNTRQRSIELRACAFDYDAPADWNKVLLRDVAAKWLQQLRRGNSEMHKLFAALLEDLLSNPAARKRNLSYGLGDFRNDPAEQHITIFYDRDPCHCKFRDEHRVHDPYPEDIHELMVDLRRFFA